MKKIIPQIVALLIWYIIQQGDIGVALWMALLCGGVFPLLTF